MLAVSSIIILELWFDQNSSVFNFYSNGFEHIDHSGLFFFWEISCWFRVINNFNWIAL